MYSFCSLGICFPGDNFNSTSCSFSLFFFNIS
jgi:hypothetical protein